MVQHKLPCFTYNSVRYGNQRPDCRTIQFLAMIHVCKPLALFLDTVSCGSPISPGNGSTEPSQNTTEGAEIFFKCNPGFVPAGRMRAVCTADGRWNPDPATLGCTCELTGYRYPVIYSMWHL